MRDVYTSSLSGDDWGRNEQPCTAKHGMCQKNVVMWVDHVYVYI